MSEQESIEQERVDRINTFAAVKVEEFFLQLENEEITEEDMLGIAYSAMFVVSVLGYSPFKMAEDAEAAAERLLSDIDLG